MIRLQQASFSPGGDDLMVDVDWHVRPNQKVGLIGRNGAGKTTLLRALAGVSAVDGGKVVRRPGLRVGYLPQQAVAGSELSVWEEVRRAMDRLRTLREAVEGAQRAVEADEPQAAERLADATEAFRLGGGYSEDEQIGEVLHGLGFEPDSWHRSCATFSGGWQMRIALARLLLSEPELALLDEPTNHLDMGARSWLAGHLASREGSAVIVSHDRHLLDQVVDRIVEVRGGRLYEYHGNFSAYLRQRDQRAEQEQHAKKLQDAEIAKMERFVERFGAKATKAAAAKSVEKRLEKIDRIEIAPPEPLPRFQLQKAPPGDALCLALQKATLGWVEGTNVLEGLDFELERGQRVAVLGPNGGGKSTLIAALAGHLAPRSGRRRLGDRIRVGVFDQDVASSLPVDRTPLEHVAAGAPMTPPERIRAVLGALGLTGDAALRPIGSLSGGERARVALAALTAKPHNALLLDEPTNHLDVVTVEVLVRALADFDGALLFVTHDRYVVETLATHVVRVADGRVDIHAGVRPEDFDPRPIAAAGSRGRDASAAVDHATRQKRIREAERAKRRLAALEGELVEAEAAVGRIDEAMGAEGLSWERVRELTAEREAAQSRVDGLYGEWAGLDETLSAARS